MESQPQNPEFKNNPENFNLCTHEIKKYLTASEAQLTPISTQLV